MTMRKFDSELLNAMSSSELQEAEFEMEMEVYEALSNADRSALEDFWNRNALEDRS